VQKTARALLFAGALALFATALSQAQTLPLIAVGTLDGSRAGSGADLSGLHYNLENGVPANALGGFGSALAYASGDTFLALPDRGPNATEFGDAIDNTASYVNRFHTITMHLEPNRTGAGLPFTLTPEMRATTLLWSLTPLVYGTGNGLGVGSGRPPINNFLQHYFTGRSDNFDPDHNSGNPNDARLDSEGMRVSNDGWWVFISDEYGPYVYQFSRLSGLRVRSFKLPETFYVTDLQPVGSDEISDNTSGRVANKGMEGLAITPDGRTLAGIMQNSLIQDGGSKGKLLRIVTIDIASGRVTHQFGYLLTTGSGVSEICALNNHEFLVDERDGTGREANTPPGDSTNAKVKQLFKIDLSNAVDISGLDDGSMTLSEAIASAVPKTLFLDVVQSLTAASLGANAFALDEIPSKIEGVAFGPDVRQGNKTLHTLWIANDNDFVLDVNDVNGNPILNPNQIFVFAFTDADLGGSKFVPQNFTR
jgi:Esterase-like activity of phytase